MTRRLVSIGGAFGAPDFYRDMFKEVRVIPIQETGYKQLDVIEHGSVVLFGGGEDISPSLYNAKKSRWTFADQTPSLRDSLEKAAFKQAQKVGAFCYGICRGAQLLCALSGGKLVQHVNGHGDTHWLVMKNGKELPTSSVHHQMMYPFDMEANKYEILGWSKEKISNVYVLHDGDIRRDISLEPEVIYFPETRSLGIQGHPEFMAKNAPLVQLSRDLLTEYFFSKDQ